MKWLLPCGSEETEVELLNFAPPVSLTVSKGSRKAQAKTDLPGFLLIACMGSGSSGFPR